MNKKILLIFVLLILFTLPAFAANWVEIPNKKGIKLLFDGSNVMIVNQNTLSYWIKFKTKDNVDNKMQIFSDCKTNMAGVWTTIKTYPSGKIETEQKELNSYKPRYIVPDSISESAHIYACKIISDNTSKWSKLMGNKQKAVLNQDIYNAEIFLRQAIDEANQLNQNGFGASYLIQSEFELADLYKNGNRYDDAIQMYQNLQYLTLNDESYSELNNSIPTLIQDLKTQKNNELSRIKQEQENQKQQNFENQRQQQLSQQQQQNNGGTAVDLINSGLNLINRAKYGY